MSIVRVCHNKNNPYVMLCKSVLEDKELSWGAKGLWAYLMSRPDDWKVSVAHLSTIYDGYGGGEDAIYKLLKEMIKVGYCERIQSNDGAFGQVDYEISEFKKSLPHRDVPDPDVPRPDNSSYTNKGARQIKEAAAASPEEKKEPNAAAAFLGQLPFSAQERADFEKAFSLSDLEFAVKFYKAKLEVYPDFKADNWPGLLSSAIRNKWAIPAKPVVNEKPKIDIEGNRAKAEAFMKTVPEGLNDTDRWFEIHKDRVEYRNKIRKMAPAAFFNSIEFDEQLVALGKYLAEIMKKR